MLGATASQLEDDLLDAIRQLKEKEEAASDSFTLLTTTPNGLMRPIHYRLLAIPLPADHEAWLDPSALHDWLA